MSRLIKPTPECIEEIKNDFLKLLTSKGFSDGRISYSKTIGITDKKAEVFFTEMAWLKMQTLVKEFDKEIAWHGIAVRGDDETKNEYIIKDILVYPQTVTGATVTTDQIEYETWLMSQEDEVFNNLRMQGHSHVNMSVSPSGVDETLYNGLLSQLDDTMFYIFMIWNKRGEKTVKIYDIAKNIYFDTSDVTITVLDDNTGIEAWLKDAKEKVKSPQTTTVFRSGFSDAKTDKKDEPKQHKYKMKPYKKPDTYLSKGYNGSLGYGSDDDLDSAFYYSGK